MLNLVKKICEDLESKDIDYMISGSLALNIYTVPRMTRDIDIVIKISTEKIPELTSIFPVESYWSQAAINDAVHQHTMFNMIDFQTGFKLDFIVLKPQPFRQAEFERRIQSLALGFPAWFVQVEDLILSKLIWIQELHSDRQLDDLKQLMRVPQLDRTYLDFWSKELSLNTHGLF